VFYFSNIGFTGSASGNLSLNVPDVSVASSFTVRVNNASATATDTLVTSGGTETINWINGTQVTVSAQGIDVNVKGQTLHGNFGLFRQATQDGEQVTRLNASAVQVKLGGGAVTLNNGAGDLLLLPGGLAGNLSGTV